MMDDSSNGFRIVDRSGKAEDSKLQKCQEIMFCIPTLSLYIQLHFRVGAELGRMNERGMA